MNKVSKQYPRKNKGVKNKTELFLWVKEETKEHVRQCAEEDEVTMSKYVEKLLQSDMKKQRRRKRK